MKAHHRSPSHPSRLRVAAFIFVSCALLAPYSMLAESQGFFSNEKDFLAQAEAGWVKIAEGVYEKRTEDGEIVRHGFGEAARAFFLNSARLKKQELLELGPAGEPASYLKLLAELDRVIEGLEAEANVGGIPSKAACTGVTVYMNADVNCLGGGGGVALASVLFTDFGPCNSANATVVTTGTPGTTQSQTGPLTCYSTRNASASCAAVPGGCYGYAFSSISFTTCDHNQYQESYKMCPGGNSK